TTARAFSSVTDSRGNAAPLPCARHMLLSAPRASPARGNPVTHPRRRGMAQKGGIAADRLKSFIERIERLEEEKAGLSADIKEIYAEAKGSGFDVKVMRQIVRLRKMDSADRKE